MNPPRVNVASGPRANHAKRRAALSPPVVVALGINWATQRKTKVFTRLYDDSLLEAKTVMFPWRGGGAVHAPYPVRDADMVRHCNEFFGGEIFKQFGI